MKRTHLAAAASIALAAVLALTACGASPATSSPQGAPTAAAQGGFGDAGGAGGAFPGASGLIAAVTGSTAQVQGTSTQTAVTWTPSTTFTAQVAAASSDIAVGVCVVARPAQSGSGTGTGATASSSLAAATVEITPKTNGACNLGSALGRGGQGGFRDGNRGRNGSGQNGNQTPAPRPSEAPTGGARQFGGFGATGEVTAVSGSSFTVAVPAVPTHDRSDPEPVGDTADPRRDRHVGLRHRIHLTEAGRCDGRRHRRVHDGPRHDG